MHETSLQKLNQLSLKVAQQEKLIIQLVQIIAVTNEKVFQLEALKHKDQSSHLS